MTGDGESAVLNDLVVNRLQPLPMTVNVEARDLPGDRAQLQDDGANVEISGTRKCLLCTRDREASSLQQLAGLLQIV